MMAARDIDLGAGRRTLRFVAGRAPLASRAAPPGQVPLLLCAAGPHQLAFDLRTLRHIDVDASLPLLPGAGDAPGRVHVIDLRERLGADAAGPGQALLYSTPSDATLRRLIVDEGTLRLSRVELRRIHALPRVLRPLAAIRGLRALVELDGGALAWLVDLAVVTEAA